MKAGSHKIYDSSPLSINLSHDQACEKLSCLTTSSKYISTLPHHAAQRLADMAVTSNESMVQRIICKPLASVKETRKEEH